MALKGVCSSTCDSKRRFYHLLFLDVSRTEEKDSNPLRRGNPVSSVFLPAENPH